VTGFEKTQLPHTKYQTYDFTGNGLLDQYTIIFHCWPCSKAMGLVSVAAFLGPCVSGTLAPLDGHGSLVLVVIGVEGGGFMIMIMITEKHSLQN